MLKTHIATECYRLFANSANEKPVKVQSDKILNLELIASRFRGSSL